MLCLLIDHDKPGIDIIGPNGDRATIDVGAINPGRCTASVRFGGDQYKVSGDPTRMGKDLGSVVLTHKPTGKVIDVRVTRVHPISGRVHVGIAATKDFAIYRRSLLTGGKNATKT